MDERKVKVLMEILEKRTEASKSAVVCSKRGSGSWKAMIMNDEALANVIMKKATKYYIFYHSVNRKKFIRMAIGGCRVVATWCKLCAVSNKTQTNETKFILMMMRIGG